MSDDPTVSEIVDARLEKRASLLQDSLELKLTKQLNSIFQERFDRALKIFGVFAVIMTGLGVKTFFDIRDLAQSAAKEEVIKKLSIDDPNSDFRKDVDKVVARGLVDSYLLSIAKGKQEKFSAPLVISAPDLRRLQSLVDDPQTSQKDFSDAIEVILKSSSALEDGDAIRSVAALAAASDDKYKWIVGQPEKRASVLEKYNRDNLLTVARSILSNTQENKTLLIAAINYIKNTASGPEPSLEHLLSKNTDNNVRKECILALASIDPSNTYLGDQIKVLESDKSLSNSAFLYYIASEIAKKPRLYFLEDDPKEKLRSETAISILEYLFNNGIVFTVSSSFSGPKNAYTLNMTNSLARGSSYILSTDLFKGALSNYADSLFKKNIENPKFIHDASRALCLENDGHCEGIIRVQLKEGCAIVLEGGSTISAQDAPAGVTLKRLSTQGSNKIVSS